MIRRTRSKPVARRGLVGPHHTCQPPEAFPVHGGVVNLVIVLFHGFRYSIQFLGKEDPKYFEFLNDFKAALFKARMVYLPHYSSLEWWLRAHYSSTIHEWYSRIHPSADEQLLPNELICLVLGSKCVKISHHHDTCGFERVWSKIPATVGPYMYISAMQNHRC